MATCGCAILSSPTAWMRWFAADCKRRGMGTGEVVPPMFQPFRLRSLELANRVVVSAMDMYCAADGMPSDFHLVHLGGKALGGAGLVMTEMVCVSADGRITPGCAGLYTPEHEAAWQRIVSFVHGSSDARIGLQLGHSGRKGATKLMWQGMDQPLTTGTWPVCASVAPPLSAGPEPGAARADVAEMRQILAQFVASRRPPTEPGSTCSSCTARTATCCRRSSRRCRISGPMSSAGR